MNTKFSKKECKRDYAVVRTAVGVISVKVLPFWIIIVPFEWGKFGSATLKIPSLAPKVKLHVDPEAISPELNIPSCTPVVFTE